MLITLCLAVLLAKPSNYRSQFPLGSPTGTSGWGVNIHFTQEQPGEIAKIAKAFNWVRMDFAWGAIEQAKGQYDFSAYDKLLASLDKRHVRPIFILDYGNDLYDSASPNTEDDRAAFCRFVTEAVTHFRHRGIVWEMWNEPNIGFWKPQPNVQQYIALATEVGKTIRTFAPDEWYIGPATSGFDWNFLQACFDAGLLQYWDAVSVHPYRQSIPETVTNDWEQLRRRIDRTAPAGKKIAVISGEWGYSDVWRGFNSVIQGDYAPRELLTNTMSNVPISIYYDWKDDGPSKTDPESHFGTVGIDLSPKPAYQLIGGLAHELNGFKCQGRVAIGAEPDYLLEFRKGKVTKEVAWTTAPPHSLRLHSGQTIYLTNTPQILKIKTSKI